MKITQLMTVPRIARKLNEPEHRVRRIVETRHNITPVARVGRVRVYDSDAVQQIAAELNAIDERRQVFA
jgi:predicted transcriptional regulator